MYIISLCFKLHLLDNQRLVGFCGGVITTSPSKAITSKPVQIHGELGRIEYKIKMLTVTGTGGAQKNDHKLTFSLTETLLKELLKMVHLKK